MSTLMERPKVHAGWRAAAPRTRPEEPAESESAHSVEPDAPQRPPADPVRAELLPVIASLEMALEKLEETSRPTEAEALAIRLLEGQVRQALYGAQLLRMPSVRAAMG